MRTIPKALALLLLPLCAVAQTQGTRPALYNEVETNWAPGQPGGITAYQLQAVVNDVIASSYNPLSDGTVQPLNANLTSLAGLTYSSLGFVKMSAAGTFSLDTNTYLTSSGAVTSISGTANQITASASTGPVTLSIPSGFTLPGTINGLTISTTTGAYTLASGKTEKVDNTLEFAGTDSTVMTFPSTSGSVATIAATQTLTNKTFDTASNTFAFNGTTMSGGSQTGGTSFFSAMPVLYEVKSVTILTATTPADIATIVLPASITRYTVGVVICCVETASGTLAAGTITLRTAAAGGGAQIMGSLTPGASAGIVSNIQTSNFTPNLSNQTIVVRQTGNSANAGTVTIGVVVYPF